MKKILRKSIFYKKFAFYLTIFLEYIQGKPYILCLGDSHTMIFNYIQNKQLFPQVRFNVNFVGGATAQGMTNPMSKTDALRTFVNILTKKNKNTYLMFLLGEVDCGFVIWYRAKKYNLSVDSQLEISINNYANFLQKVKNMGFANIFVLSAPLPTIIDNQNWGEVANLRKDVSVSQRERTKLTLDFNSKIRQQCLNYGINFVDITSEQLDENTGIIQKKFMRNDETDHHLDDVEYSKLIIDRLKKIFNSSE